MFVEIFFFIYVVEINIICRFALTMNFVFVTDRQIYNFDNMCNHFRIHCNQLLSAVDFYSKIKQNRFRTYIHILLICITLSNVFQKVLIPPIYEQVINNTPLKKNLIFTVPSITNFTNHCILHIKRSRRSLCNLAIIII